VGGGLANFGGKLGILGAIAAGLQFKEAQTSMRMADTRCGIQIAAVECSVQKTDFNLGARCSLVAQARRWAATPAPGYVVAHAAPLQGAGAALGGYTSTAEGKIVCASFLDNWNKIVLAIRDNPSLIQARANPASQANSASRVEAGAAQADDICVPKSAGVQAYRTAGECLVVATLGKTDGVIYGGEENDGFIKVETSSGAGWVKSIMMRKQ